MVFQRFCKNHKNASSKTLISCRFSNKNHLKCPPKGPLLGVQKQQKPCTRLKKLTFHFFAKKVRHSKSDWDAGQTTIEHVRSSQEGVPGTSFLRRVQGFYYFLLFQKTRCRNAKNINFPQGILLFLKNGKFYDFL